MKRASVHSGLKVPYYSFTYNTVVTSGLSTVSVGFDIRYVFKNSTIIPIFIQADSYFDWILFQPPLPEGLYYDKETRMISGIFPNTMASYSFTVYVWYKSTVVSSDFTLSSKGIFRFLDTHILVDYHSDHSISACYYPLNIVEAPFPFEWYLSTPAAICRNHSRLSFLDEYSSTGYHTWEGLDDSIQRNFTASFLGYLDISKAGAYRFKVLASTGFRLYVQNTTVPLLNAFNLSNPAVELESEDVLLTQGKHVFMLFYLNGCETAQLQVSYSCSSSQSSSKSMDGAFLEGSQSSWKIIDSTLLVAGGISPQNLVVKDILSFREHYITSEPPKFSAGRCTSYSLSASLPFNLHFMQDRGVIYGLPYSSVVDKHYELCCNSAFGSICASFQLLCTYTPLSGLTARFYAINSETDICAHPKVIKDHLDLLLEHVVESISIADMCVLSGFVTL